MTRIAIQAVTIGNWDQRWRKARRSCFQAWSTSFLSAQDFLSAGGAGLASESSWALRSDGSIVLMRRFSGPVARFSALARPHLRLDVAPGRLDERPAVLSLPDGVLVWSPSVWVLPLNRPAEPAGVAAGCSWRQPQKPTWPLCSLDSSSANTCPGQWRSCAGSLGCSITSRPEEPLTAGSFSAVSWLAGTKQRSIFRDWPGASAVRTPLSGPLFSPHSRLGARVRRLGECVSPCLG